MAIESHELVKYRTGQRQMAEALNLSYGYYRQMENDFRKPSFEILVRIKEKFREIDMNKLFEE